MIALSPPEGSLRREDRPSVRRREATSRRARLADALRTPRAQRLSLIAIAVMIGLTSWLDVATGRGHEPAALYDLPILLAALSLGMTATLFTAGASTLAFYLTLWHFHERIGIADLVQVALFFLLGSVMARFIAEYRRAGRLERELRDLNHELERRVAVAVAAERAAQQRLRASERLVALGEAAAQIVHEVKNPLVAIGGFARRARKQIPETHAAGPELDVIVEESERLQGLLRDLLEFARPSAREGHPVAIGRLLDEVLTLAQPSAQRQGVRLDFRCEGEAPSLVGDGDLLRRAVLNIVLNGIQAMPGGGCLTVQVAPAIADGLHTVWISVRDTGVGIPPERLPRVFDPFYTTKDDGTGLGLPLVKKTVEAHGGVVKITSAPGMGTEVTIRLPLERSPA